MQKNRELEVLRAIGISFVIMAHLPYLLPAFPNWIKTLNTYMTFWPGVDLFFVVSGFVITRSLKRQLEEQNKNEFWKGIFSFWARRFYRLIPASWFWLLASIALAATLPKYGYFLSISGNVRDAVAQLFHVENLHFYHCMRGLTDCGTNGRYWSLSLEEQFYLALPFAIFFLRRHLWLLCLALIIIQFPLERSLNSVLWFVRTDSMLWGVLIALCFESQLFQAAKPSLLEKSGPRVAIGIALLTSLPILATGLIVPFYTGLIAAASAIIVWIASYDSGLMFKYLKDNRYVLWIGSRSYSLYLIHGVAFRITTHFTRLILDRDLTGKDSVFIGVTALLLSAVLSELSYRYLELPFIAKGRQFSRDGFSKPEVIVDVTK